jgi:hypothetical protein
VQRKRTVDQLGRKPIAVQPLSVVAPAMWLDEDHAVTVLREAGIDAAGDETLAASAGRSGRDVLELAGALAGAARH